MWVYPLKCKVFSNYILGNASSSSEVEVVVKASSTNTAASTSYSTPSPSLPPSKISSSTVNCVYECPPDVTPKLKQTPKQDELNEKINIENEILVSLFRKRDLGQAIETDHKEIIARQGTLEQLKKQLKETISNQVRQKAT